MELDYIPDTQKYVLKVDRGLADVNSIKREHGLDFSISASTSQTAILFTSEPYAAVSFWEHATDRAAGQLVDMKNEIDRSWQRESGAHIKCPPDQELAGFQKAGVEYALRRKHTLIGDQPGLGKTMQAICFCNEIGAKRVLVICPANIRLQWQARIQQWTTMRWPLIIHPIIHGRHGVNPEAHWTIVSYDLARTAGIWKALAEGLFDAIILDEGHYLKTIDALRTRAVFGGGQEPVAAPLASRAGAILDLTGTPLPNRPREAYTAARGLCWEAIDFQSEEAFKRRFNPSAAWETPDGKMRTREEVGRAPELQARLRANFMVRRLKKDVQPQLKLPLLDIVHVEKDVHIRRALEAERLLDIDPDELSGIDFEILGDVSTVRRMMGLAVAPHAADYVEMLLEGGEEKILVAAYHTQVMDLLEKRLHRYGVLRVDGSTPPSRRQKLVDAFVEPQNRIFLGQILAIGTGTDGLQTCCSRGVCAEPDWVPGVNEQLIDRLNRMGQKFRVLFDFLAPEGSFAERILGTSIQKAENVHKALDA